jgi:branched-chain amino acid transport system ATP-binding protein
VQPFPNLTTFQNVLIGALNHSGSVALAHKVADETLSFVGLEKQKYRLAKDLTLAECKTLEIAKAIATQPKLVLLDEVMAGLNPTEIQNTIGLIGRIRERGLTIFLTEHVMHAVMKLSDRIIVIHHGKKIAEGTPQEISKDRNVIDAYLGEELFIA